jgi:hypothetical protein
MASEPRELFLVLTCAECGDASEDGARGWSAFLTGDEDEADYGEMFCPECTGREFGDSGVVDSTQ